MQHKVRSPEVHGSDDVLDVVAHKHLRRGQTGTTRKLDSKRIRGTTERLTIDAASMAMSVPAPTEKLRLAAASAGESLIPSLQASIQRTAQP